MTAPISPDDLRRPIPDAVIAAFNQQIQERFNGSSAMVYQDAIVNMAIELSNRTITREDIFKYRWLDIEGIFQQTGWRVEYTKDVDGSYWVFSCPLLKS